MKLGFPNGFAASLSVTLTSRVRRQQKTACIAAGALCLLLVAAPASASVLWEFDQVGSDVVGTFSGSLDLSNAPFNFSGPQNSLGYIQPYNTSLSGGGNVSGAGGTFDSYLLSSGPASFGFGTSTIFASSSTGSLFAIQGPGTSSCCGTPIPGKVYVPEGYGLFSLSGPLSGTVTFAGATFSSLGITPGDYVYSLPNDTITLSFVTPLPAALPLFLSGLGALGLIGWCRKRKSTTPVAAA